VASQAALDRNWWVFAAVLTARHDRSMSLRQIRRAIKAAFRKAQQGEPYKRLQRAGLEGILRSDEVMWGQQAGWHPHLHLILFISEPDFQAAEDIGERLIQRYMNRLEKEGLTALRDAQDLQPCYDATGAAEYAAKGVTELAHGWLKRGKRGSMHPFELAQRAIDGDRHAEALWREYAEEMPGTQQGRISKRLADRLGIDPSEPTEEPTEDEPEDLLSDVEGEPVEPEPEPETLDVEPALYDRARSLGYLPELRERWQYRCEPAEDVRAWLERVAAPDPPPAVPREAVPVFARGLVDVQGWSPAQVVRLYGREGEAVTW
jgi:hypothetical protein